MPATATAKISDSRKAEPTSCPDSDVSQKSEPNTVNNTMAASIGAGAVGVLFGGAAGGLAGAAVGALVYTVVHAAKK